MSELTPDLLSAYLDDECTPDERRAVEARLAADPEWQAELERVRLARDAVRNLPLLDVPAGCWDAVAQAIAAADADGGAAPAAVVPLRSSRRRWVTGGVMAAAGTVAAAVLLIVVTPGPADERPVRPPVAAFTGVHAARATASDEAFSRVSTAALMRPAIATSTTVPGGR